MTNFDTLCADWLTAKGDEAAANRRRVEIEDQLAEALDIPAEGSKTHNLGHFKVTVTQPITRKIDTDIWKKVLRFCPEYLWPVKVKIEADALGCKYLIDNDPEIWKQIASAFETKPGKIGFKILIGES